MISRRYTFWLAFVLALCLMAPLLGAQEPDDAAYLDYRQKVMKSHGASMGAIGAILKKKLPYTDHIGTHARDIQWMSTLIASTFRKEITEGRTDSKPDIWQDWNKFVDAAKTLEEESGKLAEMTAGGDMAAIGAQVKAVGKACGGCHKPFRKPKEERFTR